MNDFSIPLVPLSFSCDKFSLETFVTSKIIKNKLYRCALLQELEKTDEFMRDLHSRILKSSLRRLKLVVILLAIVLMSLVITMLILNSGKIHPDQRIPEISSPIAVYLITLVLFFFLMRGLNPKTDVAIEDFPFFEKELFKGKEDECVVEVLKDRIQFFFLRNPFTQHKRNMSSKKVEDLNPIVCQSLDLRNHLNTDFGTTRGTMSNLSSVTMLLSDKDDSLMVKGKFNFWKFLFFKSVRTRFTRFKERVYVSCRDTKSKISIRMSLWKKEICDSVSIITKIFITIYPLLMIFSNTSLFLFTFERDVFSFIAVHVCSIIFFVLLGINNIPEPEENTARSALKIAHILFFKSCMGKLLQNNEALKTTLLTNLGPSSLRDLKILKLFISFSHTFLNALPILLIVLSKIFSSDSASGIPSVLLPIGMMNVIWFLLGSLRIYQLLEKFLTSQAHHVIITKQPQTPLPVERFLANPSSLNARILRWSIVKSIESKNMMMCDTKIHLNEYVLLEFERMVTLEIDKSSRSQGGFEKINIIDRLVRGKEEMMSFVSKSKRQYQVIEDNIDDLIVSLEKEFFNVKEILANNSKKLNLLFENFSPLMAKKNLIEYFLHSKYLLQATAKLTDFPRRPLVELIFLVLIQRGIVKTYKQFEKEYVQLKTDNDDENLIQSPENYRKSFESDDDQVCIQARRDAEPPEPSPFQAEEECLAEEAKV